MYVEGRTADEIFFHAQKKMLFNRKAYTVVAPEHLIAMKLFAASHEPDRKLKDLADVREVVKHATIDRAEVRKLFVKFGLEGEYDDTVR